MGVISTVFDLVVQEFFQFVSILEVGGGFTIIRPTILENEFGVIEELIKGVILVILEFQLHC